MLTTTFAFVQGPERSPSPVPSSSSSDDDEQVDDEAELLESIEEKEAEITRTQELIDERSRQVQATLAELRLINSLLQRIETLTATNGNGHTATSH